MYYIKVKTEFVGFHKYKDAPEAVSFLRDYHRHVFKIEAVIKTTHADRQVEWFIIARKIDKFVADYTEWENRFEKSCEQVAEDIYHYLKKDGLEVIRVEVSEDGENVGGYNG